MAEVERRDAGDYYKAFCQSVGWNLCHDGRETLAEGFDPDEVHREARSHAESTGHEVLVRDIGETEYRTE